MIRGYQDRTTSNKAETWHSISPPFFCLYCSTAQMSTSKSKHKTSLWAKRLKDAMIQEHWWPKYTSKSICSCSWSRKTKWYRYNLTSSTLFSISSVHLTTPDKNKIISARMIPHSFRFCLSGHYQWGLFVFNVVVSNGSTRLRLCCAKHIKKHMKGTECSQGFAIASLLTCCRSAEQQDVDFLSADLITNAGSVPCFEGNCAVKEGLDLQRDSCWRAIAQEDKISACSWTWCLMQVLITTFFNVMFWSNILIILKEKM